MSPALLIRLRPAGPWRYGPGDGAHDRVDSVFRSDRLYSAVCQAMLQLGFLDEWLEATARAEQPAVVLSSLFPFQGDTLFAPPPETVWPPSPPALRTPSPVFLTKVRWSAAKFVPMPVIETLLMGTPLQADQWIADAESGCLLRRDRPQSSPFRLATRARVPVDRLTGVSAEARKAACVEFEPGAGLWTVVLFASAEAAAVWKERLAAAFRFLCDTGLGGSRSSGWGQAGAPEITEGNWPGILLPKFARAKQSTEPLSSLHWLLSLYSPADSDAVEWGEGRYGVVLRGGRVESKLGWGAEKKTVRMVTEGSVVSAAASIHGRAVDVAPEGFAHPVYRAGFALALQLPVIHIVEAPEPEPVVSEMDATLAAALAAAEEERIAGAPTPPTEAARETPAVPEPVEGSASQTAAHETPAPETPVHEAAVLEAPVSDSTEIESAEMEGSHPAVVSPVEEKSPFLEQSQSPMQEIPPAADVEPVAGHIETARHEAEVPTAKTAGPEEPSPQEPTPEMPSTEEPSRQEPTPEMPATEEPRPETPGPQEPLSEGRGEDNPDDAPARPKDSHDEI